MSAVARPALRLPAYGRALAELRRAGLRPIGAVVVALDNWRAGGAFPRVVCPPDADPAALDWSPCAGLPLIIAHWRADPERVRLLAECLLAVEPQRLDVCDLAVESIDCWQTVLSDLDHVRHD